MKILIVRKVEEDQIVNRSAEGGDHTSIFEENPTQVVRSIVKTIF